MGQENKMTELKEEIKNIIKKYGSDIFKYHLCEDLNYDVDEEEIDKVIEMIMKAIRK